MQAVAQQERVGLGIPVRWWFILPTLIIVSIIQTIDKGNVPIAMATDAFKGDLGIGNDPAALGLLISIFVLPYGLGMFIWGFVTDKIGPRRALLIAATCWALFSALGGFAQTYNEFLYTRVALGAVEGGIWPFVNGFIVRWFPLRERGRAFATWSVGIGMGGPIGALVATALVTGLGWRWAFWGLGILSLVLTVPLLLIFMRDSPQEHPWVGAKEREICSDVSVARTTDRDAPFAKVVLGNPLYWLSVVVFIMTTIFAWGFQQSWLPTFIKVKANVGIAEMGLLTAGFLFVGFVFGLVGGFTIDRFQRVGLIGAIAWGGAAVFLLLAAFAGTPTLALTALFFTFAFNGSSSSITQLMMHRAVPPEGRAAMARASGIQAGFAASCSSFAPAVMGALIALTGNFQTAIFVIVIPLVVAAVICGGFYARKGL